MIPIAASFPGYSSAIRRLSIHGNLVDRRYPCVKIRKNAPTRGFAKIIKVPMMLTLASARLASDQTNTTPAASSKKMRASSRSRKLAVRLITGFLNLPRVSFSRRYRPQESTYMVARAQWRVIKCRRHWHLTFEINSGLTRKDEFYG